MRVRLRITEVPMDQEKVAHPTVWVALQGYLAHKKTHPSPRTFVGP